MAAALATVAVGPDFAVRGSTERIATGGVNYGKTRADTRAKAVAAQTQAEPGMG
jgi:hypothetical protein